MPTNTYVALDKVTIGTATNTITFSSIPTTYTDLVIVCNTKSVSGIADISIRLNGDTSTNYSSTALYGTGSTTGSSRGTNLTYAYGDYYGYISTQWNMSTHHIMNYANTTTYKIILSRSGNADTGVDAVVSTWRKTPEAVNSVTLFNNPSSVNFAVGSTFSLYGIKAWTAETTPKATGGYVYEDSTYYYHAFPFSSTFTPNQSLTCDYLVVAGGGAGGNYGGGGAGGLRSTVTATGGGGSLESPLSLTAQSYAVTVGAGGSSAVQNNPTNGSNSVFSSITSTGGGRGGFNINGVGATGPNAGGSGGGGIWNGGAGGAASPSGQGFAGGAGHANNSSPYAAGGGGGAGAVGQAGQATVGGNGGIGVAISAFSLATGTGISNYYAGGGGGAHFNGAGSNSSGGAGGGGNGGKSDSGDTAGIVSTGGGGGGSGTSDASGNNGGSGIVIVRYAK